MGQSPGDRVWKQRMGEMKQRDLFEGVEMKAMSDEEWNHTLAKRGKFKYQFPDLEKKRILP